MNADGSISEFVGSEATRVEGPGGIALDIADGTFPTGTIVTVNRGLEPDLPTQLTDEEKQSFGVEGALSIDFGGAQPTKYVNVSLPSPGGPGRSQWVVTRVTDIRGDIRHVVVDTAKLIDGRVTRRRHHVLEF